MPTTLGRSVKEEREDREQRFSTSTTVHPGTVQSRIYAKLGRKLPSIEILEQELTAYSALLLGRSDPVKIEGAQTLMEVATAIAARLGEMEVNILRGENVVGGDDFSPTSEYHRFRTSELRAAQSLAGNMVTLGSRRITWSNIVVDHLDHGLPRYGSQSSLHPLVWMKAVYGTLGDTIPTADNVAVLQDELDIMVAILLGQLQTVAPDDVTALLEYSSAYAARMSEIEMYIMRSERLLRTGFRRGGIMQRFRTGELRSAQKVSKMMVDLGSRRITAAELNIKMIERAP